MAIYFVFKLFVFIYIYSGSSTMMRYKHITIQTYFHKNDFFQWSYDYVTQIWFKLRTHLFYSAGHFWLFSENCYFV